MLLIVLPEPVEIVEGVEPEQALRSRRTEQAAIKLIPRRVEGV